MADRKGFTVYLTSWQRAMLDKIGDHTDRKAGVVARRFICRGIKQYRGKQKARGAEADRSCLQVQR